MKPNFALDLSHDGISLLHRGISGWSLVGEVALDDPMMGTHLADLRRTAAELESGGVTCKLIIPNSQLLYATLDAPGPDDISREVQIRAALEGMTPYPVGDLVFDWRAEGDQARVAVLARETMDEAEGFAVEHRFNPVSFVARPDSGDFSGEPFFGKTRAATRILPPGERLVPDTSPVPRRPRAMELSAEARIAHEDVAEPARPAAQAPVQTPARGATTNTAPSWKRELPDQFAGFDDAADYAAPATGAEAGPESVPETWQETWPQTGPDLPPDPVPAPEPDSAAAPQPAAAPARKEARKPPSRRKTAASEASTGAGLSPVLAPFPPTPDDADTAIKTAPRATRPTPDTSESKPAANRPVTATAKASEPEVAVPWTSRGTPKPAIPSAPPPLAMPEIETEADKGTPPPLPFHTRRDPNTADVGVDAPARPIDFGERPNGATKAPLASDPARSAAPRAPDGGRRVELPPAPPPRLDALRSGMAEALKKPLPTPDKPFDKSAGARGGGLLGKLTRLGAARRDSADLLKVNDSATPAGKPDARAPKTPDTAPATARRADKTPDRGARKGDAEAMTVFGARQARDLDRRPRYLGAILTLGLVLVMAIVALWSMVFDPGEDVTLFNPGPDVAVVPGSETPPAIAETPPGGTAPDAETAPTNPPNPESLPTTSPPPVVDPAAIEEAVTAAQPPANPTLPATGEVLSQEAAEARYAATGIWQRAPDPMADPDTARTDVPTPTALGDISAVREVAALPAAGERGAEALPPNTMPPPPPGTSFTLGEGGLVVATREGTVAPSGILVYAGRPAKTPPPRPLEAGLPRAEGVPRVKPLPRPANLVIPAAPFLPDPPVVAPIAPEAVPEVVPEVVPPATIPGVAPADGAALDVPAQTLLPDPAQARAGLAAVVPPARPDDLIVATSNAPDGGLIDATVDGVIDAAFADASEYAVARSIQPQHRPDNFDAIVDSVREAMSDGSRVAAAPATPAPANAAPVIPASADVAARATVENALNLRDVNLIGIYGSSTSRRALVRLENGRYVKVKVGDRLEGGQVTSITASQLTYQKGRNVYALEVLPLG